MAEGKSDKQKREKLEKKVVGEIIGNYKRLEDSLAKQLSLRTPNHPSTTGTYREEIWLSLFERIVPRKFCLDQGIFIIDSCGHISYEVDIAIFDEQYTPYIFNFGKIKFIPIEAVAVAVQCKSLKVAGVKKWATSIVKLKTSLTSIVRVMNGVVDNSLESSHQKVAAGDSRYKKSQTSTRPVLILCSLLEDGIPDTFANENCPFDILLNVDKDSRLTKIIPCAKDSYFDWYMKLNHYDWSRYEKDEQLLYDAIANKECNAAGNLFMLEVRDPKSDEENVVLSLTFQLNQLLMLLNNPIFFPHQAYVTMFQNNLKNKTENGGK